MFQISFMTAERNCAHVCAYTLNLALLWQNTAGKRHENDDCKVKDDDHQWYSEYLWVCAHQTKLHQLELHEDSPSQDPSWGIDRLVYKIYMHKQYLMFPMLRKKVPSQPTNLSSIRKRYFLFPNYTTLCFLLRCCHSFVCNTYLWESGQVDGGWHFETQNEYLERMNSLQESYL